jgi:DNA repair exonuclease SbcCD ATPase subunit
MKIEKIKIQNFYSFKDQEFSLGDYSGLTLIKGINKDTKGSNGSGKSVLIEAVYFGLTGKTIRKSTEDSLVNNQAKKHCVVEVHLTHNNEYVVITRRKKPTKLEFLVGDDNRTQQSVFTTQAAIDSFLNINHKVLLASMFFGQSNDVNFLDCSADDKRTIIRNFLNLDDIFEMRDRIRNLKSSYYQDAKTKDAVIEENQKTIANLDNKIGEVEKGKKAFATYDEYTLSLSLEDILDGEKKEFELDCKISALDSEVAALQDREQHLEERIKNPDEHLLCDMCGSLVAPVPIDVKEARKDLNYITNNIKENQRTIKTLEVSRWSPPITSREFVKVLEYKDLCRDETNYAEMKTELVTAIACAQKNKDESKLQYEVMRFWEKAFSEQGVIKYIINNVLEYFNERCNYYVSYLTNSKYSVEFDQELTEKIETSGRLLPYISLSGGEKRKVNLAIMLGLKDLLLLTDKSHVDLLFFDEVAENIDEEGVQGLFQLLQEIKKNKTIFIITHNKHLKTLLDSSKRVTIIKHKGISKIKV